MKYDLDAISKNGAESDLVPDQLPYEYVQTGRHLLHGHELELLSDMVDLYFLRPVGATSEVRRSVLNNTSPTNLAFLCSISPSDKTIYVSRAVEGSNDSVK